MTKAMNTEGIEKATGKSFAWWCKALDKAGAKKMNHTEIAKLVRTLAETSGWWAQGITVAYEQHTGRRMPGQRADGTFSATVSLTVEGAPEDLLARWQKAHAKALPKSVSVVKEARSKPEARYISWRATLRDGTSAVIGFDPKPNGKSIVAVEHQKLTSFEKLEGVKAMWRKALRFALI
jgi:hypothetical protein